MKRRQFTAMAVALMLLAVVAYSQTNGQRERFTANAVSLSPEYGTGQRVVDITVDRWSPTSERQRLVSALQTKGPDELLKQLQKNKPVGRIRTPDTPIGTIRSQSGQEPDPRRSGGSSTEPMTRIRCTCIWCSFRFSIDSRSTSIKTH